MYIWIIFMLLCVFLDQITKYLVVIYMDLYESVDIIPGVLRFTYIRNEGAAFGSFSDSRWVFMVLSAVAIVGILVYFFVKKPQNKLFCSALTLIVGGGVGNMIDRIRLGYVVDFIDFYAFPNVWKWNFNVADSFVCVGAGLVILWMIIDIVKENKKIRQSETESTIRAEGSDSANIQDVQMNDIHNEDIDRIQDDCENSCQEEAGLSENGATESRADVVKEDEPGKSTEQESQFTIKQADEGNDNLDDVKNTDNATDSEENLNNKNF